MFSKEIYIKRREQLKKFVGDGAILFLGNKECPMNYSGNSYPFRQDSTFLYYFGIDRPGMAAIIDVDNNKETIYGDELTIEDTVWMGKGESLEDICKNAGIDRVGAYEKVASDICKLIVKKQKINYLPPYRAENTLQLAFLLDMKYEKVKENASEKLIKAVVAQRSVKEKCEIEDMETTMNKVTGPSYIEVMRRIKPGMHEYNMAGLIEGIALQNNCSMAYPVICSINGEILHNHNHGNLMEKGAMLLIDAGAESPMHYANDITRTIPVSGTFNAKQKDVYNIVLRAEEKSIESIRPGVPYQQIHLNAARIITDGLKALGLMKGNTDDAVANGAHALFFPHGLGHMLGLDVHDMEDIGEDFVGYDNEIKRIDQFGTAYLRLGRRLQTGFVLTVEPGIYFIPVLIEQWNSEGRFRDYINYDRVMNYLDFGGIRIEENVVVTENSCKIIGNPIPKDIGEIESLMAE